MAQVTDSFADGDLANPPWSGDTAQFVVSAGERLQLQAPYATASAYLSTPSRAINNAVWEGQVFLDFDPSGSNYARIYLVADQKDLSGPLNGYFLKIGGSSDEVSLYRQAGASTEELIDGQDERVGTDPVDLHFRVTRNDTGYWELWTDTSGTGSQWQQEGQVVDRVVHHSAFFGVFCDYTSTRSDKFFFDDFHVTGDPFVDTLPPQPDSVAVVHKTTLDLLFSEPVTRTSAEHLQHYEVTPGPGSPISVSRDLNDPSLVHLSFGSPFLNAREALLHVEGVKDTAGNALPPDSLSFFFFQPDTATKGDVVINELLPDPSPPVGLPEAEYIELFHAGDGLFDLEGWRIGDGSSEAVLPFHVLRPGEFVVLVDEADTALFADIPSVVPVGDLPSLNNGGDDLVLYRADSLRIDQVSYRSGWYDDPDKDQGGWALERINPTAVCPDEATWTASQAAVGGTPGETNSVFDPTPDTRGPSLEGVAVRSHDTLELAFDEKVDTLSGGAAVIRIQGGPSVDTVWTAAPFDKLWVTLREPLDSGRSYTLTVEELYDCPGNAVEDGTASLLLPFRARPGDVVINELLFDPVPGGEDFVELYNRSGRIVDLRRWSLARMRDDTLSDFEEVTAGTALFRPGEYRLLTPDSAGTVEAYPASRAENFLPVGDLPTYTNDSGTVVVLNREGREVDRLAYREDMHFPLLDDTEGVSLERQDPFGPTNTEHNWHSAARDVGYATPGYENSQYRAGIVPDNAFRLSPEVFSPDHDGHEDVLSISYQLDRSGFVGTITIHDRYGRPVRHLTRQALLGQEGAFTWNGLTDEGRKVPIGLYAVIIEVFDPEGRTEVFRKPCVVGGVR